MNYYKINETVKLMIIIRVTIMILGLIGNWLSFKVFSRQTFTKSSIAFYCKCLSLFNSFTLIQLTIDLCILITGIDLIYTKFGCRLSYFVGASLSPIPNWILVYFSLDQMLAVCRMKLKFEVIIRKRQFQIGLIVLTLLSHLILYSPVPIFMSSQNVTYVTQNVTVEKCDINSPTTRIYSVVYLVEANFMPFLLMIVTTSVILKCLCDSRRKLMTGMLKKKSSELLESSLMVSMAPKNLARDARKKRELKFGINSVVLNVVFVLLTSPVIVNLIFPHKNHHIDERVQAICLIFFYLNYALNFCTHLCVNSIFRNEFVAMIGYS